MTLVKRWEDQNQSKCVTASVLSRGAAIAALDQQFGPILLQDQWIICDKMPSWMTISSTSSWYLKEANFRDVLDYFPPRTLIDCWLKTSNLRVPSGSSCLGHFFQASVAVSDSSWSTSGSSSNWEVSSSTTGPISGSLSTFFSSMGSKLVLALSNDKIWTYRVSTISNYEKWPERVITL